jgi:hypothetical protein
LTPAPIGHRDARFTLNVYTDAFHRQENPAERIGALVGLGTSAHSPASSPRSTRTGTASDLALQGVESTVSGG